MGFIPARLSGLRRPVAGGAGVADAADRDPGPRRAAPPRLQPADAGVVRDARSSACSGAARCCCSTCVGAYAAAAAQWAGRPGSMVPMIGASGAISAVIGAFALSFGQAKRITGSPRLNRWLNAPWLLAAWVVLQLMIGWLAGGQGDAAGDPRAYRRLHRRAAAAAAVAAVALPLGLSGSGCRPGRCRLARRARAAGGGGRRHISSRRRRPCAGPCRARRPRPRHSCRTGRPGRSCRGRRIEAARVLDPPAEHQVKLAHAGSLVALARGARSRGIAPTLARRRRRRLSKIERSVSLALLAGEAELGEARVPASLAASAAALAVPVSRSRGRAQQPGLARGARQQSGHQRAGGEPAGKRDQRRLVDRVGRPAAGSGDAVAGAVIGLDRALRGALAAGRRLSWRSCGLALSVIRLSPCLAVASSLALCGACALRLACTPSASLPARSISGSRARNRASAATTPLAMAGRAATASTASSARSAPFSLAPSQASWASVARARADPAARAPCPSAGRARARPRSGPRRSRACPAHQLALRTVSTARPAERRRRRRRRSANATQPGERAGRSAAAAPRNTRHGQRP